MPFSSGIFQRLYNWVVDRDGSVKITASRMDGEFDNYRDGINAIVNGTQAFIGPLKFTPGTVGSPGLQVDGDSNTGIARTAADTLALVTAGTARITADATGGVAIPGAVTFGPGAAATPALTTTGDLNTGIYFPAADQVGIATGGTNRLLVTSTYMDFNGGSVLRDGFAKGTAFLYSSSGAHVPSTRARRLEIEILGAGGGGGGVDGQGAGTTALAGSGGGGSYQKIITDVVAQTVTITIGAAGAGGAAGNNAGGTGSTTTVALSTDGTASCPGGQGGDGELATSGFGASQGGVGGTAMTTIAKTLYASDGAMGSASIRTPSGTRIVGSIAGGNVLFSGRIRTLLTDGAGNNATANQYGTGGAGASAGNVATNYAGGNGAGGLVIVTEYY